MNHNCIVKTVDGDVDLWWTGNYWSDHRAKAARYGIGDAEDMIERMRSAGDMAFWERYDKNRSAL